MLKTSNTIFSLEVLASEKIDFGNLSSMLYGTKRKLNAFTLNSPENQIS